MKKITDYLIYGLFFCIFIMGCTKEPLIPPVEPPITIEDPIIKSLIATPATIFKDSTSVLSWETLNAVSFSLILQNGDTMKNLSTKGNYRTSSLNKDATFVGIAYGKGSTIKSKFVIVNVKDSIPPPLLVFAVVHDSVIKYKSNTTVSWTSSNGISVLLNGIPVGLSGSRQLVSLAKDTILHFRCYGSSDSIIKDAIIKVEAPTPLELALEFLQKRPYRMISQVYSTTPGGTTYNWPIPTCGADDSTKFALSGRCEQYNGVIFCDPSEPQMYGNPPYCLHYIGSQLMLDIGGADFPVLQLDSTTLVLYHIDDCIGCPNPYNYWTDTYTNQWPVGTK